MWLIGEKGGKGCKKTVFTYAFMLPRNTYSSSLFNIQAPRHVQMIQSGLIVMTDRTGASSYRVLVIFPGLFLGQCWVWQPSFWSHHRGDITPISESQQDLFSLLCLLICPEKMPVHVLGCDDLLSQMLSKHAVLIDLLLFLLFLLHLDNSIPSPFILVMSFLLYVST